MKLTNCVRLGLASACLILVANTAQAEELTQAERVFERMGTLVGDWRRQDAPDSTLGISFQYTANNSVLVETWRAGERMHSLTLYHLDGASIVATHYCPQGNQPRLKWVESDQSDLVSFAFWDVTNLQPGASHQHDLSFSFADMPTVLIRGETYRKDDETDASSLSLVRVSQ